jgi:deglycase
MSTRPVPVRSAMPMCREPHSSHVKHSRVLLTELRMVATALTAFSLLCMLGGANATAPERGAIKPGSSAATTRVVSPHARLMRFLLQPVDDPDRLRGYRVAILAADGVDGFDLEVPRRFLAERGAMVHVIVPRPAKNVQGGGSGALRLAKSEIRMLEPSGEQRSASFDRFIDQVQVCEYDIVYLASNRAIAGALAEPAGIAFLKQAAREAKPILATGNSAFVLFKAGLLDEGVTTGNPSLPASVTSSHPTASVLPPVNDALIYTNHDAFDMPVLMDNLIATLLGRSVSGR